MSIQKAFIFSPEEGVIGEVHLVGGVADPVVQQGDHCSQCEILVTRYVKNIVSQNNIYVTVLSKSVTCLSNALPKSEVYFFFIS